MSRNLTIRSAWLLLAVLCVVALPAEAQDDGKKSVKTSRKQSVSTDGAPELTEETSKVIDLGLKYLLSQQRPDGAWDAGRGNGRIAVGDTSLVLMAFMVKGYFPGFGPHAEALNKGKNFLLKQAKESSDGYLGGSMYEHGLATLALSELWGMTKDDKDDEAIQKALELAVKVILCSQDVGGGWRYTPVPQPGDTSITVMQLVALASARQAGVTVPDKTIQKGVKFLASCQAAESGGFSYMPGQSRASGPCSAGATYVLQLCGQRDAESVKTGLRYLKALPDAVFMSSAHYYYFHYYGIHATVQSSDEDYGEWYPKIRDAMLEKQSTNGAWSGGPGGTAQSTGMAIIVLGTPHRFLPIYQR